MVSGVRIPYLRLSILYKIFDQKPQIQTHLEKLWQILGSLGSPRL